MRIRSDKNVTVREMPLCQASSGEIMYTSRCYRDNAGLMEQKLGDRAFFSRVRTDRSILL